LQGGREIDKQIAERLIAAIVLGLIGAQPQRLFVELEPLVG